MGELNHIEHSSEEIEESKLTGFFHDSLVHTTTGLKPIYQINPGDVVYSIDEKSNKIVERKVLSTTRYAIISKLHHLRITKELYGEIIIYHLSCLPDTEFGVYDDNGNIYYKIPEEKDILISNNSESPFEDRESIVDFKYVIDKSYNPNYQLVIEGDNNYFIGYKKRGYLVKGGVLK